MHPSTHIQISEVVGDEEILAVREVMLQLRPSLAPGTFLATVRRMMQSDGYHLAAACDDQAVRAVAGYRFMEMLYCGKILYIDDLITDERYRSRGYGRLLLGWLKAGARSRGCGQVHLDSNVQRESAHRFYFREGLTVNCFHFRVGCKGCRGTGETGQD